MLGMPTYATTNPEVRLHDGSRVVALTTSSTDVLNMYCNTELPTQSLKTSQLEMWYEMWYEMWK